MKIIYIFFIFHCFSCANKSNNDLNKIIADFIDNTSEGCLIIPGEGCGGCISEATGYFLRNKDSMIKKNIHVIFTGVGDLKNLNIIIGKENVKLSIVHIDSSNILINKRLIGSYPIYYSLHDKHIVNSIEFSPSKKKGESIDTLINAINQD